MGSRAGSRSAGNGKAIVPNEIIINVSSGETRVAIIEQGAFAELHIERDRDRSVAGMVAKGRVTRVLPGMQAAFVDIGLEKAAFLYVGDYLDEGQLDPEMVEDEEPRSRRGRGRSQRTPPKIDTLLREGQEIVVQVAKEPIGTKGARITSHVSIAGRHLVLTPWAQRVGVSRRIESDRERRRLREIVSRLRPRDLGFIIRTAGDAAREADLEADIKYLSSVWGEIQVRQDEVTAPAPLYSELSLPLRAIRDFANSKTKRIVIDADQTHEEMQSFIARFVADPKPRLEHYRGVLPIFDHFGIESAIDDNLGKKVWLKSGGYLIIDQSEALTAIDVNTGRYVGKRDLEETVLKTNLEAVQEVVYQLRFRNIGGLIIIDLIDMESAENREKVYRALQDALRHDKAKTNILKISELGLVEMTRKRTRENLVQQLCEPCSHCEGRGYVLSKESVAFKVLREIRKDLVRFGGRRVAVTVSPLVSEVLLGPARRATQALGESLGREIEVHTRPGMHQEQFEVTALDVGEPVPISLPWLRSRDEEKAEDEAPAEIPEPSDLVPGELGAVEAIANSDEEPPPAAPPVAPPVAAEGTPEDVAGALDPEPLETEPAETALETALETAIETGEDGSEADEPGEPLAPAPTPPLQLDAEAAEAVGTGDQTAGQALDEQAENPILPDLKNREDA